MNLEFCITLCRLKEFCIKHYLHKQFIANSFHCKGKIWIQGISDVFLSKKSILCRIPEFNIKLWYKVSRFLHKTLFAQIIHCKFFSFQRKNMHSRHSRFFVCKNSISWRILEFCIKLCYIASRFLHRTLFSQTFHSKFFSFQRKNMHSRHSRCFLSKKSILWMIL